MDKKEISMVSPDFPKSKITFWEVLTICLFAIILQAGCDKTQKKDIATIEQNEGFSLGGSIWIVEDEWFNDYDYDKWPDWENTEYWRCVEAVSTNNIEKTISLLKSKSIIPISLQQAKDFTGIADLEPDLLLEKMAQREDNEAERREMESNIPFFANDKRFKEWADEHRQNAVVIRKLKGKTKPYLCRGLLLNEKTGSFTAFLKDSTLMIRHNCLGNRSVPMTKRPVVVFLENVPKTVYVFVMMAE